MVKDPQILAEQGQTFTITKKQTFRNAYNLFMSCNPSPFLVEVEHFWKFVYFVIRNKYLLVHKMEVAAELLYFI